MQSQNGYYETNERNNEMKDSKEHIMELLHRFMAGETTEQEEQVLAEYFANTRNVPKEFLEYKMLFDSFATDAYDFSEAELDSFVADEKETEELSAESAKTIKTRLVCILPWLAAACILAAIWLISPFGKEEKKLAQVKLVTDRVEGKNSKNDIKLAKEMTVRENVSQAENKDDSKLIEHRKNKKIIHKVSRISQHSLSSQTATAGLEERQGRECFIEISDLAAMAFPTAERIEIVNEDAGYCYMVTAFDDAGNGSRYSLCMTDETEGTFVINNIEE